MENVLSITSDPRPIQSVYTQGDASYWAVGRGNVTKITPYEEPGQGAMVPWVAIYEGDVIAYRVNCAAVEHIGYDAV